MRSNARNDEPKATSLAAVPARLQQPAATGMQVERASTSAPEQPRAAGATDILVAELSSLPVRVPAPSRLTYAFDLRQQWEGVVTSVSRDELAVVLRDLVRTDAPEIDAVLPLDEIAEDDLPLLAPGAVLYRTIGYEQTETGQRKRVSTIRLRRLPAWSRADVERVRMRARELDELFSA